MQQTGSATYKLKPRLFHKSAHLWVHLADFHPQCELYLTVLSDYQVCCCFWVVLSTNQLYISYFKSKIAFSCHNFLTLTPVPLLGTPFNTISYFSDYLAYLLNASWQSRQIQQRGCSSLRSPSSTIQPGWTASSVPGPSIVSADNNPNWENTPATNTIIANRPTFFTCS